MIRKMNDICDRPVDGYELKINHFVNEIFYYIFHNVNLSKELSLKESRDLERMKDVMIYLNKTIDQKHTLADIASYCHLSNSECCRPLSKKCSSKSCGLSESASYSYELV